MREPIAWVALVLGALLVLSQLIVSIAASVKTIRSAADLTTNATAGEILKELAKHVPLAVAGIVLILIAAVVSGDLAASIVFGEPSTE